MSSQPGLPRLSAAERRNKIERLKQNRHIIDAILGRSLIEVEMELHEKNIDKDNDLAKQWRSLDEALKCLNETRQEDASWKEKQKHIFEQQAELEKARQSHDADNMRARANVEFLRDARRGPEAKRSEMLHANEIRTEILKVWGLPCSMWGITLVDALLYITDNVRKGGSYCRKWGLEEYVDEAENSSASSGEGNEVRRSR